MLSYQHIVAEWVDELSAKLGWPKEELLKRGLSASDFPSQDELAITFPDGSTAHFRFAFFLVSKSRRSVAVFTEHCGYHIFPLAEIEIRRITQKVFGKE